MLSRIILSDNSTIILLLLVQMVGNSRKPHTMPISRAGTASETKHMPSRIVLKPCFWGRVLLSYCTCIWHAIHVNKPILTSRHAVLQNCRQISRQYAYNTDKNIFWKCYEACSKQCHGPAHAWSWEPVTSSLGVYLGGILLASGRRHGDNWFTIVIVSVDVLSIIQQPDGYVSFLWFHGCTRHQ